MPTTPITPNSRPTSWAFIDHTCSATSAKVLSIIEKAKVCTKVSAMAIPTMGCASADSHTRGSSDLPLTPRSPIGFDSWSAAIAQMKFTADSAAAAQIGAARPHGLSSPPMNGPSDIPTPKLAPISPMPRARSSGSVTSAT